MTVNESVTIISDQMKRALWEVKNVIDCIPEESWNKKYCEMPLWKHVYHMLHSLDLWFINPRDDQFREPSIHEKDLNNLDVVSEKELTRIEIDSYYARTEIKIRQYLLVLKEEELLAYPESCEYNRFTLIIAQIRHLHTHMGMIMEFIIADMNLWPRVLGLEGIIPDGNYDKYF
ncbi:hypothetical protein [uncultured Robinsoniella sp.]|uniref:hypothetical protein n=1 Tax=uncultured Robinsoniella sp. TaxID=904190 RepID=UPI00374EEE63